MPLQALNTLVQAWRLLVAFLGAGHLAVGIMMLADGPSGLIGPVFSATDSLPWWTWGAWAAASGIAVLVPRFAVIGLCGTVAWYALWASLLLVGIVTQGGPLYAIPVYVLLTSLHVLVLMIDRIIRNMQRPVQARG